MLGFVVDALALIGLWSVVRRARRLFRR